MIDGNHLIVAAAVLTNALMAQVGAAPLAVDPDFGAEATLQRYRMTWQAFKEFTNLLTKQIDNPVPFPGLADRKTGDPLGAVGKLLTPEVVQQVLKLVGGGK